MTLSVHGPEHFGVARSGERERKCAHLVTPEHMVPAKPQYERQPATEEQDPGPWFRPARTGGHERKCRGFQKYPHPSVKTQVTIFGMTEVTFRKRLEPFRTSAHTTRRCVMIDGLKLAVVLPAYNASQTLERTFAEIPMDIVDDVILVDDASTDLTAAVAHRLGIHTIIHARNGGYGANQKSCYTIALARGADIVVMLHPDYQYSPRLLTAMAGMIASGHYDAVFASRFLGGDAQSGGIPRYKYVAN